MRRSHKPGFLMTANWDSGVGYAWWLMESYWAVLAGAYDGQYQCFLAYPTISTIPENLTKAPVTIVREDFSSFGVKLIRQVLFVLKHRIRVIYFSDKPVRHWAYILFRLMGVRKIVVHDHTPGMRTPPSGIKKLLKRALLSIPGIKADVCIGATEFVRKRLIEVACVPEDRCFAVPNGISTDLPQQESIYQRFNIPQDRKVIVTAARANRYKGGFFALDVLAELSKNGCNNWHYVYMGDGPDLAGLIQRAEELGIGAHVTFPGRVNNVLGLSQASHLAFHPSSGEVGYSLSILEYMLCGLPVVVPDNPSVCGATKDRITGLFYSEGGTASAAGALQACLHGDIDMERMGILAKKTVRDEFSLSQAHEKLRSIFSNFIQRP